MIRFKTLSFVIALMALTHGGICPKSTTGYSTEIG
jgi:hypothetical protein